MDDTFVDLALSDAEGRPLVNSAGGRMVLRTRRLRS